jgi:hypothetical protein
MKTVLWLVGFALAIHLGWASAVDKMPLPQLDADRVQRLKQHLEENALAPHDYIVGKFEDHDVVVIGEMHRVKHQVQFIHELIPELYRSGVYILATEFARREDQWLVDSLLALPEYDEMLARDITFRQHVHWGYQEYVDIYKTAWELNNRLPGGSPRFRILALNDSPKWELFKTQADVNNDQVRKQAWEGCGEDLWARVVLDEVAQGEKVLVYCGINHGFTSFQQPVVDAEGQFLRFWDQRAGNFLFEALGKRVITVYLHAPWPKTNGRGRTYPADGGIDAVMRLLGSEHYPAGFDVAGTPFGELTGATSSYSAGYDPFGLGLFCDGYVFIKPLSSHEGTSAIRDFVNEGNVARARAWSPNPKFRDASPDAFYLSAVRDGNIAYYYRKLY